MDEKDLTREQRLEIEEKAIEALLQMGVKFTVPLKVDPPRPSKLPLLSLIRGKRFHKSWDVEVVEIPDAELGRMKSVYVRRFSIKPLYLGTIDFLRKLYMQMEYSEETLQANPIPASKKLFQYIPNMAEIAAVTILNNPRIVDSLAREVQTLKTFLIEHLTVSRLQKLAEVIAQMMNPAGFTNSIRLIREIGTTRPSTEADLVE